MTRRLHHYVEARLYEDRWTASCTSVPSRGGFGGVSATSGRLDDAVAQVISAIAEQVDATPSELTVVVETDPSEAATAAAPNPGEPYRIRVCVTTESSLRSASLGTNAGYMAPENAADIPGWVARLLADDFWLTEAEHHTIVVEVCWHPGVDHFDSRNMLRDHAWEANEPSLAAMKLRYKKRLDAMPKPDNLTAWMVQQACDVITMQGHHRYQGPEFTGLPGLVAACRNAADMLEPSLPG